MTLKRLAIFMFLPLMMLSLWSLPASADEQVAGSGECKMDEDFKTQLGVKATQAMAKVVNSYRHYVNFLKADYEGGGVCSHLYNPMNHNGLVSLTGLLLDQLPFDTNELSFLHGLEDAKELEWTDYDKKGAEIIDTGTEHYASAIRGGQQYKKIKEAGFTCASVLERTGSGDWKDYTDYHIGKMVKMAKKTLDGAVQRAEELKSKGQYTSQMATAIKKYEDCYKKSMEAEKYRNGPDGFIQNRKIAENNLSILGGADTQCECKKDAQGNPTDKVEECWSLQETVEENLKEECKTIAMYQSEMGDLCITCGIMAKILGAAQRISKSAFVVLAGDLSEVLGVALLIFIAYTVLLAVASPEAQKLSKFLTTLLVQGGKVAIAVLLLSNPEYLYDKAINPILDGGVDFGLAFTNIKADGSGGTSMDNTLSQQIKTMGAKYAGDFDSSSKFLSADTMEKLVGANNNFSKEAALMPAIGRSMICNSTHNLPWIPNVKVIPRIKMLLTGIILLIFGVMIWLAIGFYILDCCLQLCLVVAMMPFFVACWPFRMTSAYVKVGWNMFLNTFFNFIMMSVVIVTIAQLTYACLPTDLQQDINEDNIDTINDQLEIIGLSIIIMVTVCLISLKLSRESGRLANKFAGGAQIKMGADLGGMAGDMATKGVKGAAQGGAKALGKAGGSAAEASGLKGFAQAKGNAIKNKFGGGTKSKGASFKQNSAPSGGDKGDKGGDKGGDKPEGNS